METEKMTSDKRADSVKATSSLLKEEEREAELQKALDLARESTSMLDAVHEVLSSASWKIEYGENGKETKTEFSDGVRHLFGYQSQEDFPNSPEFLVSIVHPSDKDRMLKEVYDVLNSRDQKRIQIASRYRAYRKDGTVGWYRVQGLVKRRDDGSAQLAYGVIMDATRLEEAEIRQREALEAFESIHDAIGSGNWQMAFNEQGNMTSCIWSDRFRRMIGYQTEEDFPNLLSSWTDLLHPADKKMVLNAYWAAVNDRTGKTAYAVEYRLLTRTKGYRWFSANGSLSRYADGAPKTFYGIIFDVNDQVLSAQSQEASIREITELNQKLEENQAELEASAEEQESQMEEISALNAQLQENQAKLEETTSEQEAQIKEINALNSELEEKQQRLEEAAEEQEAQIEEMKALNQELQESKEAVSEAFGMVKGLSTEYHTMWLVDKETLRMKLIRSNGISTAKGAVSMAKEIVELDPTVKAYVAKYVMPEDRERTLVEMSSAEILRHLAQFPDKIYSVNYLRKNDNGHISYHQIAFANADTENNKKQFVLAFRDIDQLIKDEQSKKEELENALAHAKSAEAEANAAKSRVSEAYGMIEGFSQEYHTIWVVDKVTSRMRLIRSNNKSTIQNAVQMGKDFPEFNKGFEKYINAYVVPEDQERMHKQIAFAEILRQLQENPNTLYAVNYLRRDEAGHVGYHQIAFANADTSEGVKQFVYGFRDVDSIVKEEQKQKQELQDALNLAQESVAEQEAQLQEIQELNNSLTEYNNIMSNAGYGMWHIILKDGVEPRMKVNDKMAQLLGIDGQNLSEEELYHAWYDQIVPEAIPSVQASVAEMMSGNFSENTYQWIHPKKGTIYVRCGGTAVTLEDGTNVLSGYHADVTDIVLKEMQQKAELEKAKDDAEAANAAKTSFLFNMSHDIRTPMNAIMGFRDLLEKHQEDPAKRTDYLNKIRESSNVLLSIINNVLEMARIEKGTVMIDETAWSAEQFNDTLYSVFAEMMEQKGLTFTRQIEVQHPYVFCDPIKLREIFINVLSNAYKYTNAGGSINMHLQEIPSDRDGYAMYQTTITDTGIGMSEDFLPHLYEEFAREYNTTDAKVEGTGLGMPIVKRLVDLLEGTIEVHSKKGEGTTFIITIPHRIADKNNLVEIGQITIDPKLFEGKRILLAEDNDLNAEIATEILTEAGFIVDRAEDGAICVEKLKASAPGYYQLILMDIQMPNMNGYEATKAIRNLEDDNKASIKIFAMTANAFEEDKREAMLAGMNGHIAKPVNVNELMKTLASAMG